MFDNLICWYGEYFTNPKNDRYRLLKSSVFITMMNELYKRFVANGEIIEIEDIDQAYKEQYWNRACEYYETQNDRIRAAKSIYVIQEITLNYDQP